MKSCRVGGGGGGGGGGGREHTILIASVCHIPAISLITCLDLGFLHCFFLRKKSTGTVNTSVESVLQQQSSLLV